MSSRRTLILLGAVAVGAVAALLLLNWVRGIEDRAFEGAERVDVFTAQAQVVRGTAGETAAADGSIATSLIPQEFRPATAITSVSEIERKVALFDIAPGTVIVQGMFVDPAETQISFRARLKDPDHVAVTVAVDGVRAVGGFLVPGDEVNILVTAAGPTPLELPPGTIDLGVSSVLTQYSRVLYQGVHILAVGQAVQLAPGEQVDPATQPAAGAGGGLLTFNVPPEAALWITSVGGDSMYLTLIPEDYTPRIIQPIDIALTTLPGEDPAQLTPYGPEGFQE